MNDYLIYENNGLIEICKRPNYDPRKFIPHPNSVDNSIKVDINTGEVLPKNQYQSKYDALPKIRTTMNNHRRILLYNASFRLPYVYFITLTCANHMSYEDFNNKFKQFRRRFRRKYPNVAFMTFKEVQKCGNYHLHMVAWHEEKAQPIAFDYAELADMWGESKIFPDIRQLHTIKDINDVAFYLCNYSNNDDKIQGLYYFPPKAHLCCYNGELKKPEPKMVNLNDLDLHMYKLRQSSKSFGYEFQTYIREEVKYA